MLPGHCFTIEVSLDFVLPVESLMSGVLLDPYLILYPSMTARLNSRQQSTSVDVSRWMDGLDFGKSRCQDEIKIA